MIRLILFPITFAIALIGGAQIQLLMFRQALRNFARSDARKVEVLVGSIAVLLVATLTLSTLSLTKTFLRETNKARGEVTTTK